MRLGVVCLLPKRGEVPHGIAACDESSFALLKVQLNTVRLYQIVVVLIGTVLTERAASFAYVQ